MYLIKEIRIPEVEEITKESTTITQTITMTMEKKMIKTTILMITTIKLLEVVTEDIKTSKVNIEEAMAVTLTGIMKNPESMSNTTITNKLTPRFKTVEVHQLLGTKYTIYQEEVLTEV